MTDKREEVEYVEDEDFSGEQNTKAKMKKLREKLSTCEEEKKHNLEGWQRSKADLLNYKREVEAAKSGYVNIGSESVITDLLPVIDAFYSAMSNKNLWEKVDKNWRTGMEYIYNQLLKTLADYNAEIIVPQTGDVYDENIHNVSVMPNMNALVVEVVHRPGLKINHKIIRSATVTLKNK
jgi:molecular chaperone GrpE (heat shock protein)